MTPRPIRVLLFSTLYPSSARPGHGIFVETRLRELLKEGAGRVEVKVMAPVPWVPRGTRTRREDHAAMACTPRRERHNGIDVLHPRYAVIPKVGMTLAPLMLAAAALRSARRLIAEGFAFDLIDAHYFYPDGVAAAWLGRALKRPVLITARGSDINLIASHRLPRRMMLWAAGRAAGCIGVSQALVDSMRAIGMPEERLHMFRNGVDLDRFQPLPQAECRQTVGASGAPLLLSVGNLVPLKGHDLCIDALNLLRTDLPGARLVIVGTGPQRDALQAQAHRLGLQDRVRLVGAVANVDLARWYGAADILMLASSREGWPNVLLEAMACGTPVVATAVGGIPEIVSDDSLGQLVHQRHARGIADAVLHQLKTRRGREATRQHAERFGWRDTSKRQLQLFERLHRLAA